MAPILTCPDENELLPVATGEPAVAAIEQHLEGCPDCRDRLERLRAELTALRRDLEGGRIPPSTEPDPALHPEGRPSGGGTTLDWTSDPLQTAAPEPIGPEAVAAARQRAEAQAERPGAIGKYLVVETLGSGAQGDVYRVIHPGLGQDMVLKLGRRPVGGDERVSLVKEGRLLKDLEHINLVKIYDLDFHNEQPFLVMEYIHGRNLEDYARDEPITPRRAAELVARLAGALAMVHRRGVIHRDIKPRNILIDESGEPRLIDFGLGDCGTPGPTAPTRPGAARWPTWPPSKPDANTTGSARGAMSSVWVRSCTNSSPANRRSWARPRRKSGTAPSVATSRRTPSASPRSRDGWCGSVSRPWPQIRTGAILRPRPSRRHCGAYLIRPKVLGVLSAACALAVLGPLVLNHVWPRPDPIPSQISTVVIERAPSAPISLTPAALRVESFHAELHGRVPGDPAGRIGSEAFVSRVEQDVRVQVQLSIPAHCFLIALNPNGTTQLCYPKSPEIAPAATATIDYPPDPLSGFGLTDGAGTQAFVLVASAQPLPPYGEWTRKLGNLPWKPAPIENVWQYNGRSFGRDTPRGDVRPLADLPPSLEAACRALRAGPGVEAIQALAFPVKNRR